MTNVPFTRARAARTLAASAAALAAFSLVAPAISAQDRREVPRETIDRWLVELSNKGRWGANDERGTLNLITPQVTAQAASLVRKGISVSLSHDYVKQAGPGVTSPWEHEMRISESPFVSDRYSVVYHGGIHSHMDALCHNSYEGRLYNGFVRDEVVNQEGCARLGITNAKQGIVTRGVLIDMPRLRGVARLDPGTPIYVDDIEAWEARTGIRIRSGDVLFFRTGRWSRPDTGGASSGPHVSIAPWLRARGVAMIGSDFANEVRPTGVEGIGLPVHLLTLVTMGMPIFDNLDLERLAEVAAAEGRWEFMLVAAPLAVGGGTGSPLNPLAIF